jgi:hypothetical protein
MYSFVQLSIFMFDIASPFLQDNFVYSCGDFLQRKILASWQELCQKRILEGEKIHLFIVWYGIWVI